MMVLQLRNRKIEDFFQIFMKKWDQTQSGFTFHEKVRPISVWSHFFMKHISKKCFFLAWNSYLHESKKKINKRKFLWWFFGWWEIKLRKRETMYFQIAITDGCKNMHTTSVQNNEQKQKLNYRIETLILTHIM